jgi:hypothetical protein
MTLFDMVTSNISLWVRRQKTKPSEKIKHQILRKNWFDRVKQEYHRYATKQKLMLWEDSPQ